MTFTTFLVPAIIVLGMLFLLCIFAICVWVRKVFDHIMRAGEIDVTIDEGWQPTEWDHFGRSPEDPDYDN